MNNLSKKLDALPPRRRVLFELLLKEKEKKNRPTQVIPRRRESDLAPVSYGQEQIWLLEELDPGNSHYNNPASIRIQIPLDVSALERSLSEIIRRHESLRTTFTAIDGKPMQRIRPPQSISLPLVDLSALPAAERQNTARLQALEEARQPFDLEQGPLMRARLLRLAENDHALLLTMHHIITDGWSTGVFLHELTTLYDSYLQSADSPLPELPIQYADYAVWQREWLKGEALERQLRYWRENLEGAAPILALPTDKARPAVQRYRGATLEFALDANLSQELKKVARQEGVTLFMTLLSAFFSLLYRYSQQEDIVVGTLTASRTRPELEGVIGYFINTLPLRTEVRADATYRKLLEQAREVCVGAYAHQEIPFEKLIEELHPERKLSHSPLFQVMFNLINLSKPFDETSGFIPSRTEVDKGSAKFELALEMQDTEQGLTGTWVYNTDVFEEGTIRRMALHFRTLLKAIVTDLDQRISELPLAPETERQSLPFEENDVDISLQVYHQLFEAQAARAPEAVAVVCEGERTTYGELNARSNRLAHSLVRAGVGRDVVVSLLARRGINLLTAILAVFKAGGAYLPLDPSYPAKRLSQVLEQSGSDLVLVAEELESELLAALESNPLTKRPSVRSIESLLRLQQSEENPGAHCEPDNLAYVIYTSGSTGVPKGAMIEHRGMLNHLFVKLRDLRLTSSDVVAQTASQSFDISVWQFLAILLAGGQVHIINEEATRDSAELLRQTASQNISILETVPSMLSAILGDIESYGDGRPRLPSLRWLIATGEALPPELCRRWLAVYPRIPMLNAYGPTECSDDVTHYVITQPPPLNLPHMPIGREVRNLRLYILDRRQQPLPVGVAGELYVGGIGVGRGYLNDPSRTAEVFTPSPFAQEAGGTRLYKTGDLARYIADGNIEYRGRIDYQVKVRGFRIELAEIEAALRRHEAVGAAAVVAIEGAGTTQLVAYVVGRGSDAAPGAAELREWLGGELPSYMTQLTFVALDSLPLTENGKLDRKALPEPEAIAEREPTAPRTSVESILADIWAEALRLERVGVEDNFFELGGHSLLATQVITRVRQFFGVELPLRALFESLTVAGLARRIEVARGASADALAPPPLAPVAGRGTQAPLSFAQQRLWFLDQLTPGNSSYNIPAAVRMQGRLDAQAFERSLNEIINRHEALRTTFPAVDGQPAQVIAPTRRLAFPVIDLQHLPENAREAQAKLLATKESQRLFNLAKGPLLRAKLLRLGEEDHVALLTTHHIVSDGWSSGVLVRELTALYEAYSQGMRSPLDELPIQYSDYAIWQREWLKGEVLEAQLAYWRGQLFGLPSLNIPTDHPRPVIQSYRGAAESLLLPASLTDSLKGLSRRHGVTLFMTLLGAFQTLLMRHTGQEDVVVGSPIANRGRAELEGLIGFFINTLALRTDLSGDPSFTELLERVREVALGAYAHQDLPFDSLVEALQPERDPVRHPLFQVMMVLQSARGMALELPGLNLSELQVESATTRFDLTLSLAETELGLACSLGYSSDLFEAETVRRMLSHYRMLLESVVADPQRRLSELEMLTEEERERLVVEWNRTEADYAREQCVHELFERQVELTPERTAVVFEDEQLSYAALNGRANQLARRLRRLGVGPDMRVGVFLNRSCEMLVAVMGAFKAGAAYVPLDPSYPEDRLSFMLEDAGVSILLTEQSLAARLSRYVEQVVCLDADGDLIAGERADNLACDANDANLAYVIYTSGSTGRPKGVMIEHRSAVNFAKAHQLAIYRQRADECLHISLNATFAFDPAVERILLLLYGHTVHVWSEELRNDPQALISYVRRRGVDVLDFSPAQLRLLIEEGLFDHSGFAPQLVLVGGEAIDDHLWRSLAANLETEIFNVYGPTECTVNSAVCPVRSSPTQPSIGRPLANVQIYILDESLRPAPVGAPGEIYIGGAGLARGYLERPGLTAEKFVPNLYSQAPGARLYKTSDRARFLSDGRIKFLDRADNQVKIRGFRIELGEVEAALGECPLVKQAVVVAREDSPGDKRLVAYIVANRDSGLDDSPTPSELRKWLGRRLPDYMTPSAFVALDSLPLTPNGKLDHKALPAPDQVMPEGDAAYVALPTPAEEVIAAIWSLVLGIERVGVYDNFFELGGHSLLVTGVISRVREAFGIELPMRVLFEAPVLAEFARSIELAIQAGSELDTIPLEPISRDQPIPLTISQQYMLEIEQKYPGTASNNVPILIRLRGEPDLAALEWSLGEIIRRHEILRTTFETSGGVTCQIIHPPAPVQIPVVDLIGTSIPDPETHARRLAYEEGQRPFDLALGPLLRAKVIRLSADEHLLLLVFHHIVIDPWSLSLFMQELTTLCGVFGRGEREAAAPLPDLPVQFADYAVWQRKWLQGEGLKSLQNYWRERLGGRLPSLNLPRKLTARRAFTITRGATCPVELPASLSGRIKTLSLNEGATPFICLLAAFKATLYLYTGNTDIIVTSPMANRQRLKVESLIGFFATSVALRTKFDEGASFRELLRNVRETALGAYMRQALPLEKVVEALREETDLSEDPIGRVNFALLTFPVSQQEMGKLGSQMIDIEAGVASADLSLTLWETSEGFKGNFNYSADTLDEEFVLRMAGQFQRLLQNVVSDPDQKLCSLNG